MVCQIKNEGKRDTWQLGVIEDLIRGPDGLVRAVTLRTKSGVTNRPIARLYPLEIMEEETTIDHVPKPEPLRRSARLAAARKDT